MLNIYYGDMEDVIYNTSSYFKFNYDPKWFEDPNVVAMVRDVDQSVVLGNGAIDSPVLGVIAPVSLSGGVKTLILIDKVTDNYYVIVTRESISNLPYSVTEISLVC